MNELTKNQFGVYSLHSALLLNHTKKNVSRRRSAVDHATTKTMSMVIDSALLDTLERLHFGDDRPAGRP